MEGSSARVASLKMPPQIEWKVEVGQGGRMEIAKAENQPQMLGSLVWVSFANIEIHRIASRDSQQHFDIM
jgi:hypothetical protein